MVPNTAPVANPDSYTVHAGHTLTVDAPGYLGNDTDVDGHPVGWERLVLAVRSTVR